MLGDFILETENFVVCQLSVWMQVEAKGIGLTLGGPGADKGNQAQEQKQNRTLESGHGCVGDVDVSGCKEM